MQTRTICCKLVTTPEIQDALEETSRRFAAACNYISQQALTNKGSSDKCVPRLV